MNSVDVSPDTIQSQFDAIASEAGFSAAGEGAGGGTGPGAGAAANDPGPQIPTGEILFPAGKMAAARLAPNWRLSDEEVKALADAYGALVDKYFPGGWLAFFDRYKVELSAVMITYTVLGSRLGVPRFAPEPEPAPAGEGAAAVSGLDLGEAANDGE